MKGVLLFALATAACASAGAPGDQPRDDAHVAVDAPSGKPVDGPPGHPVDAPGHPVDSSPIMIDARIPADAAPIAPDASTDGNPCTANNQCTDDGECCLKIDGFGFCSEGDLVGSTCFPPF